MKNSFLITLKSLFILLFMASLLPVHAQIGKRIKKRTEERAEQRVEDRVNQKVDNTIDKGLDKLEGIFKKKNKNGQQDENLPMVDESQSESPEMGDESSEMGDVSISIEEDNSPGDHTPNEFIGSFKMDLQQEKKGKPVKDGSTSIHFYTNAYQTAFRVEDFQDDGKAAIIIMDKRNRIMITKTEANGEKTATKMRMPKVKATVADADVSVGEISVEKTGEYKTIEGYRCQKYLIETEEQSVEAWMAEDLDIDFSSLGGGLAQVKGAGGGDVKTYQDAYGLKGFSLESHSREKGKDEVTHMYIKELVVGKENREVFDLSGYRVMDLSRFMPRNR
jgi:hypothetical protein